MWIAVDNGSKNENSESLGTHNYWIDKTQVPGLSLSTRERYILKRASYLADNADDIDWVDERYDVYYIDKCCCISYNVVRL